MPSPRCCDQPSMKWRQTRVGDRRSDIYVCSRCQHIDAMESWLVPLSPPDRGRCANCSGHLQLKEGNYRCDYCGLTSGKTRELHDNLSALHPSRNYLQAALAAAEMNRFVIALKLSTAAILWNENEEEQVLARAVRLQSLEGLGELDRALDEAYEWSTNGAPPLVWGVIADLEAAAGNMDGALAALKNGIAAEPENLDMWLDLAELFAELDDRGKALSAASHGLNSPESRPRALAVIADIAERYYADSMWFNAEESLKVAGDLQDKNVNLAWLRARLAASAENVGEAVQWLDCVLQLEPSHTEAQEALQKLRPKKKGWLW